MAKFERRMTGDMGAFLDYVHNQILSGSMSATYEDGSEYAQGDLYCAVRVYERYSYLGGNRVSLSLTVVGTRREFFVSAIAAGGSQAMFFKINTFGEETFLERFANAVYTYEQTQGRI